MVLLRSEISIFQKNLCSVFSPQTTPWNSKTIPQQTSVFSVVLYLLIFVLITSSAFAASVTLGWGPNPEPDLEGYVIYRNIGSPFPPYEYLKTLPESELANPLYPKATITELQEGKKYYIALTAYNTEGAESGYSDSVCIQVVENLIQECSSTARPGKSTGINADSGSGGSSGCLISSTKFELNKILLESILKHFGLCGFIILVIFILLGLGIYGKYCFREQFNEPI